MAWIQAICAAHPQASGLVLFVVIVTVGEGVRRLVLLLHRIADALLGGDDIVMTPRAAGLRSERRRVS